MLACVTLAAVAACDSGRSAQRAPATVASLAPGAAAPLAPSSPSSRPPAGRYVYEGTIAGKPVLLRLHCDDLGCTGYYFYEKVGQTLELVLQGDGFDERVGVGDKANVTGHLVFSAPPGPTWNGTWTAPAGASAPITLARVELGHPRAVRRSFSDRVGNECHVTVDSVELVGLADAALEDRLDTLLAPEHLALPHATPSTAPEDDTCGEDGKQCSLSARGYRILCRDQNGRNGLYLDQTVQVTLLDHRILSMRQDADFDGGGMHPSLGVGGLTVDLRTGLQLDARDLLKKPDDEPPWSDLSVHKKVDDEELDAHDAPLAIGHRYEEPESPNELRWMDFFLTPTSLELVPIVSEAARILRQQVQTVPLAKARRYLRANGPAAYLYGPARKK